MVRKRIMTTSNEHNKAASNISVDNNRVTAVSGIECARRSFAAIWLMASLGTLYSWSIFVRPIEVEFAQSRTVASATFSVAIVAFTIGMLTAPSVNQLLRASIIAFSTCLLAAMGLALAALSKSVLFTIIGYGGIFGLANGWGYSFSLQIIEGISKRRGLFIGVAVASYTAGSALASPILSALLNTHGYRMTLLFLAAYLLLAGALVSLMLRNVILKTRSLHSSRQEKLLPSVFEFAILWVCFLLNSMIGVMLLAHAAPLVSSFGGSERNAVSAVVAVSLGNGFGRLFGGWFADSFPGRTLLVGAPAMAFLAFVISTVSPSAMTALFLLAMTGTAYGSIASGMPTIIATYYGGNRMAWIYGRVFTAWGLAGVLGPIVAGAVFDQHGDYKQIIVGAMTIAFAAGISGALYRPRVHAPKSNIDLRC